MVVVVVWCIVAEDLYCLCLKIAAVQCYRCHEYNWSPAGWS